MQSIKRGRQDGIPALCGQRYFRNDWPWLHSNPEIRITLSACCKTAENLAYVDAAASTIDGASITAESGASTCHEEANPNTPANRNAKPTTLRRVTKTEAYPKAKLSGGPGRRSTRPLVVERNRVPAGARGAMKNLHAKAATRAVLRNHTHRASERARKPLPLANGVAQAQADPLAPIRARVPHHAADPVLRADSNAPSTSHTPMRHGDRMTSVHPAMPFCVAATQS
jgi:hypothetical protein